MLKDYTVCFFGHRRIENFNQADARTEKLIPSLIQTKDTIEFLVGREGEYDQIVSSAVRRVRKLYSEGQCWLTWVLPYPKAELENNKTYFQTYYDSIEICDASTLLHPKAAIQARNRNLVDRSDLCVFFVERQSGGAWTTMRYALRQRKKVVNLAREDDEDIIIPQS